MKRENCIAKTIILRRSSAGMTKWRWYLRVAKFLSQVGKSFQKGKTTESIHEGRVALCKMIFPPFFRGNQRSLDRLEYEPSFWCPKCFCRRKPSIMGGSANPWTAKYELLARAFLCHTVWYGNSVNRSCQFKKRSGGGSSVRGTEIVNKERQLF